MGAAGRAAARLAVATLGAVVMRGHDLSFRTADSYRAFAAEACGRSPRYEELALAVAGDARVLGFLDALPTAKRQPNLLFAAARYLLGEPPDLAALHVLLGDREDGPGDRLAGRP
jgi:hypothetical protein